MVERRFDGDELTITETVEAAKTCLEAQAVDAIFLDHDLPDHYKSNDHNDYHNTG